MSQFCPDSTGLPAHRSLQCPGGLTISMWAGSLMHCAYALAPAAAAMCLETPPWQPRQAAEPQRTAADAAAACTCVRACRLGGGNFGVTYEAIKLLVRPLNGSRGERGGGSREVHFVCDITCSALALCANAPTDAGAAMRRTPCAVLLVGAPVPHAPLHVGGCVTVCLTDWWPPSCLPVVCAAS